MQSYMYDTLYTPEKWYHEGHVTILKTRSGRLEWLVTLFCLIYQLGF